MNATNTKAHDSSSADDHPQPRKTKPSVQSTARHNTTTTSINAAAPHTATSSSQDAQQISEVDELTERLSSLKIHDHTFQTGYNEAGYDGDAEKNSDQKHKKVQRRTASKSTTSNVGGDKGKKKNKGGEEEVEGQKMRDRRITMP